jgi:hypothetical protein
MTVGVDTHGRPPLTRPDLMRLTLWLAYYGNTCDCFRSVWRRLFGEKFSRLPAIRTYGWLTEKLGDVTIDPLWEERVGPPPASEWSWRGEVVDDGMFPGLARKGRRR